MTPVKTAADILGLISSWRATGESVVLATVVCTVAPPEAKAGAKTVILPDSIISKCGKRLD
jgi:hypothetical protein